MTSENSELEVSHSLSSSFQKSGICVLLEVFFSLHIVFTLHTCSKNKYSQVLTMTTATTNRSGTLITSFSFCLSFLARYLLVPFSASFTRSHCHVVDNKSIRYHWRRRLWESEEIGDLRVERGRRPGCWIVKWSLSLSLSPTGLLCVRVSVSVCVSVRVSHKLSQ